MSEKHDHDSHYKELSGEEGKKKIAELVKDIGIAMMTTVAKDGKMSSRPMAVQDTPFDGTLWFLTRSTSAALASAVPEGRRYTKVRAGMRVSAPISPHWSRRTVRIAAAVRARIRSTKSP